jgi:hypothetical protein
MIMRDKILSGICISLILFAVLSITVKGFSSEDTTLNKESWNCNNDITEPGVYILNSLKCSMADHDLYVRSSGVTLENVNSGVDIKEDAKVIISDANFQSYFYLRSGSELELDGDGRMCAMHPCLVESGAKLVIKEMGIGDVTVYGEVNIEKGAEISGQIKINGGKGEMNGGEVSFGQGSILVDAAGEFILNGGKLRGELLGDGEMYHQI